MTIYILDTDHLSLYGRNHPILIPKLLAAKIQLTTTAINVEEQLRGRLAQVAEAKEGVVQSNAYQRLVETVMLAQRSDRYGIISSSLSSKFGNK
ncbi:MULTISPECIES: hypothetical protein [Calothrix]|uniref:hypothetical protein n=1 Tax=Calothrix TaxID=1186 RepID=UPI001F55457D|nr:MULTISPECIES: hypothetical protein [Calothrix]